MVRAYRLGGAERERARALIRILGIDMDRVRWLDGHPMTVRVFDDGKCWVEYTGLVVCDKETSIAHSDGHVSLNFTTKVTPKGQQYLIQKYLGCTPLDLEAGA